MVFDGIAKKPCPNCGGKVEWWFYSDGHYASNTAGAQCTQCKKTYKLYDFHNPFAAQEEQE
jgi:endogenous inhibitor of DNA gyrase (YacG/DUF329 family)